MSYIKSRKVISTIGSILDYIGHKPYESVQYGTLSYERFHPYIVGGDGVKYIYFPTFIHDKYVSINEYGNVSSGSEKEVLSPYCENFYFVEFGWLRYLIFKWKFKKAFKALENVQHTNPKTEKAILDELNNFRGVKAYDG